jgi:hypothetical protein
MFASFLTPLDSDQVPSGDVFLLAIVHITHTMPIMMSSFCRSPTAWWSSAGVQLVSPRGIPRVRVETPIVVLALHTPHSRNIDSMKFEAHALRCVGVESSLVFQLKTKSPSFNKLYAEYPPQKEKNGLWSLVFCFLRSCCLKLHYINL